MKDSTINAIDSIFNVTNRYVDLHSKGILEYIDTNASINPLASLQFCENLNYHQNLSLWFAAKRQQGTKHPLLQA